MKSKKAKEFIDGLMDHLTVDMTDHAKWQLRVAMTRAAELAEQEVEERMRAKAIEALDQTIRAVLFIDEKDLARYKDIFIQKLTEQ